MLRGPCRVGKTVSVKQAIGSLLTAAPAPVGRLHSQEGAAAHIASPILTGLVRNTHHPHVPDCSGPAGTWAVPAAILAALAGT